MHKKKVLFMINSMYGGGAEKIFQTLLNNLEPSKYDITVYSVNQCKIDHKYYPENIKYKYIFWWNRREHGTNFKDYYKNKK